MKLRERIARDHAGHMIGRSNAHDRTCCITCDVWVEPPCRCGGDRCEEYSDAPERPSMVVSPGIETLYRAPRVVITARAVRGFVYMAALAIFAASVLFRACERVVAAWSLGPAVQVHPAIRAWDAGRDR